MTYKDFSSRMRQLNNEQIIIIDDILYQEIENPLKPFHIFLTSGVRIRKTFTFMCSIQKML